jgi:hypothetical protein
MQYSKYVVGALAVGLLGATVALGEELGHRDHGGDFASRHREMCDELPAREAGRFAYLEARLKLSPNEQSAFDAWRNVALAAANTEGANCVTNAAPDHRPTLVDREVRHEKMLKVRLAALDAELPALQALYNVLTPDQKAVLDMSGHHGHEGRDRGHEGHDGDHEGHDGGPDHDGNRPAE